MELQNFLKLQSAIKRGTLSCVDLVEHYLAEIDRRMDLNAFLVVMADEARRRAEVVDGKIKNGSAGKLAGMVLAVKDNLVLKDKPVTCGSHILENFISPYHATVIQKLIDADAILIGKTNMDEFAMGSSNENSYFGPVLNPIDETKIPGGSSGGSAVSVAANLAYAAFGSDTGGSIRQPAAMCGVVGLKPTYGRVSRFGLVAFASSFDQIGPITRSVRDAALLLSVIAGYDPHDSTSANLPVPDYFADIDSGVRELKLAFPKEYLEEGIDTEVEAAVENVLHRLKDGGAGVEAVTFPSSEYALATYYILANAEASSNLSRFDGARYGFRAQDTTDLESMYTLSRSEGFGEEVKRRIMMGTYVLSAGYYDAYYRKAQKVRTLIKREYDGAFKKYDGIIAPTTPTTAFKLGEKLDNPLQMYLSDIYTIPANLAGFNSLSLPCGVDANGLPIGVQIMTRPFNESMTFRIAQFLEDALQ
ncbi:MAG TPA: Asp-tRNA(Asn)/Glu-tRNA(Gln) amidotransferase subunit GatA [Bacteroidetes bacterium]|nr:Asp-tRNA(Asn)/Glu-tRNA(Gln) amidotransferase subunit GatA [Bacteroidota bacterium]